jgi:3D (Asp-Asp-Asp) domain-containing protein
MRRLFLLALAFSLALPILLSARTVASEDFDGFLTQNLWVAKNKGYTTYFSAIDFEVIPAGSKVSISKVSKKGFVLKNAGEKIKFEYIARHFDMDIDEFLDRLVADKNPAGKWAGFSSLEKAAIKEGRIQVGMSKAAVLVSAGYPVGKFSDATANHWTYQRNRFVPINVLFVNGKVSQVGNEK